MLTYCDKSPPIIKIILSKLINMGQTIINRKGGGNKKKKKKKGIRNGDKKIDSW